MSVQPNSGLDEQLDSLRLIPAKYRVNVHGIGREIGYDIYSVISCPLSERNNIAKRVFGSMNCE